MIKLKTKDLKTRLLHLGNTVECGLHSGIPACCVKYYATEWLWKTADEKQKRWKKVYKVEKTMLVHGFIEGWGYVPCPMCLKKKQRIKKLKKCNCYHAEECAGDEVLPVTTVRLL